MATSYDQEPRVLFLKLKEKTSQRGRKYLIGFQGETKYIGFYDEKSERESGEAIVNLYIEAFPYDSRNRGKGFSKSQTERAGARSDARQSSAEMGDGATTVTGSTRRKGESSRKSEAAREIIDRYVGADAKLDDDIPF